MTEWSPKQDAALHAVDDWLKNGTQQVFRLFGYAGTGKTTMARHFAEGVEGDVLFGAFTGKAAHVLRQKGCPATTIHQMIYHTHEKGAAAIRQMEQDLLELRHELQSEGSDPARHPKVIELEKKLAESRQEAARPFFILNQDSPVRDADLVVIDECSMVDDIMGQDLLSFGTKVLVLGDPAQLPPVGGAGFFTEKVKPDVMLEEIHRQARDNPIIDMATTVRRGDWLDYGTYGANRVIRKQELTADIAMSASQILVGKNKTRFTYNKRLRELHGRATLYPEPGDRLVCLRNDHELGLLNGAIWNVAAFMEDDELRGSLTVTPEDGGSELSVSAHLHHFLGRGDELPWFEKKEAQEFDYGYALTCHKAQGSQWPHVLVVDESSVFREDAKRWLYTAITRASETLIVAR